MKFQKYTYCVFFLSIVILFFIFPLYCLLLLISMVGTRIVYHFYWIARQTSFLPIKTEKIYLDRHGYFRYSTSNRLIHRDIAYRIHYIPNPLKYTKPFREYIVHHRDQNKKNNHPSNLVILEPIEHAQLHGV